MNPAVRRRWFAVHRGLGRAAGLLLYVLCVSGTAAVLGPRLLAWELPASRAAGGEIDLDRALAPLLAEPGLVGATVFVELPTAEWSVLRVMWFDAGGRHVRILDPTTGAALVDGDGLREWLRDLHADLWLPGPWGRWLVGLLGLLFALEIATGVAAQRRLFATLRPAPQARSPRTGAALHHRRAASGTLPFHALLAWTGALLGLVQLVIVAGALGFAGAGGLGDTLGALEELGAGAHAAESAGSGGLEALRARAASSLGAPVAFVRIDRVGTPRAHVRMEPALTTHFSARPGVSRPLAGDGPITLRDAGDQAAGEHVVQAVFALHFGWSGGRWSEAVYLLFGLGTCAAIASGVRLAWHEPGAGAAREAVLLGVPLALALALVAAPWLQGHVDWFTWTGAAVLALALAGAVVAPARSTTAMRRICAAAWLAVPLANAAASIGYPWSPVVGWIDALSLFLAWTLIRRAT